MNRATHIASLVLVLALACGGDKAWRQKPQSPGDVAAQPAHIVVRPGAAGVDRYNVPGNGSGCEDLARALAVEAERIAIASGATVPRLDSRLCLVAEDMARLSGAHGPPPYDAVAFAMQHHGIIEPSPHLLVVQGSPNNAEGVLREVIPRLESMIPGGDFARIGAAEVSTGSEGQYVIALQESHVVTEPIGRVVPRGSVVIVKGRVLPPYGDPQVLVTAADGSVSRRAVVKSSAQEFWARVRCGDAPSTHKVEVIGHASRGATVLANFPVYCGIQPPATLTMGNPRLDDGTGGQPDLVEQRLYDLLNASRRKAGLPALIPGDEAASVARRHGVDMRDAGFVGHVSPTSGSAQDRMRRAGLVSPVVLENVARAYSAQEAHTGLMESPGHRANILSDEVTHVGIGVVKGSGDGLRDELYITQVFYAVPPEVSVPEARRQVVDHLARERTEAGLPVLGVDPELATIAQQLAERLASGEDPARAQQIADAATANLARRYSAVTTVRSVVGRPDRVSTSAALDPRSRSVGVGVAQGDHPDVGRRAIFVVLLVGRTR